MFHDKPAWIIVKGTEFNPGRSLSLGQILAKPNQPGLPLLPDGPLPIPASQIEFSFEEGVEDTTASALDGSFGVWADLDVLPVLKGDVGGHRKVERSSTWQFAMIECQIFTPRAEYVTQAIRSDDVQNHIRGFSHDSAIRKRLYMVTGVRIARGARKTEEVTHEVGMHVKAGVDLAALVGVPVTVGVEPGVERETAEAHSFLGASDFVYAYRLAEIHYGKHAADRANKPGLTADHHKDHDEPHKKDDHLFGTIARSRKDCDWDGKLQQILSGEEVYFLPKDED